MHEQIETQDINQTALEIEVALANYSDRAKEFAKAETDFKLKKADATLKARELEGKYTVAEKEAWILLECQEEYKNYSTLEIRLNLAKERLRALQNILSGLQTASRI